jgi:hypothetical protein
MKLCRECKKRKSHLKFYAMPAMADGLMAICKDCHKARMKHRRMTNPLVQAYDRERAKTPERKARARHVMKRWLKEHPEKMNEDRRRFPEAYAAHTLVNNAIKNGRISKQPCKVCGAVRVTAHHEDYSRPLDVVWLCPQHHSDLHLRWHRPYVIEVK